MLIRLLQNAECWIESSGGSGSGKIYDLLFVRVVKMCSVSSFHTKDIKLDSINNRALVQEWSLEESDVKFELSFLKNDEHVLHERGRKYPSSIENNIFWMYLWWPIVGLGKECIFNLNRKLIIFFIRRCIDLSGSPKRKKKKAWKMDGFKALVQKRERKKEREKKGKKGMLWGNGWGSIASAESAMDKSSYGKCRGANQLAEAPLIN